MNGDFIQITGLPRCGSAFLSVMFNHEPDCISFHDLAATDENWRSTIETAIQNNQFIADCSTYAYLPKALTLPSTKVYIRQNPLLSRERAIKAFKFEIPLNSIMELHHTAERWALIHNALTIELDELFKLSTLEKIWSYCFQGKRDFPSQKIAHLLTMNVQRNNPSEVFSIKACEHLGPTLL